MRQNKGARVEACANDEPMSEEPGSRTEQWQHKSPRWCSTGALKKLERRTRGKQQFFQS